MSEIKENLPDAIETANPHPHIEKHKSVPNNKQQISAYSGPIPPPAFLENYEKLVPGSAKRFLEEPHIEAEHRRSLEQQLVNEQIKLSKRGQILAFTLASCAILGAFITIFLGYDLAGLGALLMSITALVGVFYCAQKKQP